VRSPEVKSAAENKIPAVPPLVLLLVKNAPPTVAEALIENEAGDAELVTIEGLAVVAAVKTTAVRVTLA